jgi:hypothetical protein
VNRLVLQGPKADALLALVDIPVVPDSVLDPLRSALSKFAAASAELLDRRELLRRVDSKFVVAAARLDDLIARLAGPYAALRVPSGTIATYQSLYFDTAELRCFHDHRRGRRVRHKIRIRHYPDREVSYLDVKTKRNELVTDKHRLQVPYGCDTLGDVERAFLRTHVGAFADELRPELRIDFRRIGLIGLGANERVTIDVELEVRGRDDVRRSLGPIAVVEVKQSPFDARSAALRALADARVRQQSMSKYSIAVAITRPDERNNRLQPELRAVERIPR